jgi:hypothetical protein
MSGNAIQAQGTLLKIGTGTAPSITYTAIKEIKSFTGPGGSAAVIDVTDLSSPAKEKRMGLHDEGQLSFTMNYLPDDTQHALLRTNRAGRVLTPFNLTFTDATPLTWGFNAYITSFVVSGAVDGVIEANVTLEITGAITET